MNAAAVLVIFGIAGLFLVLFLIRLRNVGTMTGLWPLAANTAAWLVFGLWELHVVLGFSVLAKMPVPWPGLLLILFLLSMGRR